MRTLSARVTKSESKGTKSVSEDTKSEPKGSQKGPTWNQNGAKMEPKSDENASKNRFSEKVDFMIENVCPQVEFLGPILGPKIRKIDAKIDVEKRSKNGTKMIGK